MKLLVIALEASANLHLSHILEELKEVEICGIFDEKFGTPYLSSKEFGVMGFLDIIPKILKAKKAIKELVKMSFDVDKVLLIDSPAFNLPLAKAIKEKNPKVNITYYILPQVWAWKAKRVKKVEKYCDNLASILPFEQNFYNKATYVGHPLLDENYTQAQEKNYVTFLPGSRKAEIQALMPIFREVAKKIEKDKLLCIPANFSDVQIKEFYGDISDFEISRNTPQALAKSKFAFVCSGTATLEASLCATPFVLVYKAKKFDYFLAKKFVKIPFAGLANIIMYFNNKEPLHKELFQDDVNVLNLIEIYKKIDIKDFQEGSKFLHQYLQFGATKNVCKFLKEL